MTYGFQKNAPGAMNQHFYLQTLFACWILFYIGACGGQTASEEPVAFSDSASTPDRVPVQGRTSAGQANLVLNPLTPAESMRALKAVSDYMECEECVAGELDSLVAWGPVVMPMLEAILERGASNVRVAAYRDFLNESYDQMAAYQDTLPMTRVEMVETYLAKYEFLYRIRAAQALGAINTPAARTVLQTGLDSLNLREDINDAIREALGQ